MRPADPIVPIRPKRVQLLVTCLVDRFFPDTGMSVVAVLERLGLDVECPAGADLLWPARLQRAAIWTKRARWRATRSTCCPQTDDPIVVPSGSCGDMVIHQYEALFRDDPVYLAKARAIHRRARTSSRSSWSTCWASPTSAPCLARKLTYHACCHGLRGLGVADEPAGAPRGRRPGRAMPAGRGRRLLRLRRPVLRQDAGHLVGDARPQARPHPGERRRHGRRHRRELRHAHGRRPAPARQPRSRVRHLADVLAEPRRRRR